MSTGKVTRRDFPHFRFRVALSSVLIFICTSRLGAAGQKPAVDVDLLRLGIPVEIFQNHPHRECPFVSEKYGSIGWFDPDRVLVALSTSPYCSKKAAGFAGTLRLMIFDSKGNLIRSKDLTYESKWDYGYSVLHNGGISIGPQGLILVELIACAESGRPQRAKVLVLSEDFSVVQEIDTDYHQRYYDRLGYFGVLEDRSAVLFSRWDGVDGHERQCFLYTGVPLHQTGSCKEKELYGPTGELPHEYSELRRVVRGWQTSGVEFSQDKRRAGVFAYKEPGICDMFGAFCPKNGRWILFDLAANRILKTVNLPIDSLTALSPNGRQLVVLAEGRFRIFALP